MAGQMSNTNKYRSDFPDPYIHYPVSGYFQSSFFKQRQRRPESGSQKCPCCDRVLPGRRRRGKMAKAGRCHFAERDDEKAMDQEEIQALAKKMALELGCDADEETGFVSTDISMDRGQALHIDLALTGDENRYEVRSWYVYDSGNYEIDDFMPVWDGK